MNELRHRQLKDWLQQILPGYTKLYPIAGDASFRNYWRLTHKNTNFVIMDAPPELESIEKVLTLGQWLFEQSIGVPEIFAFDEPLGFVVIEDLGEVNLYQQLCSNESMELLQSPIEGLFDLAHLDKPSWISLYSEHQMLDEMRLFSDWFLDQYAVNNRLFSSEDIQAFKPGLDKVYETLAQACINQPQVFVHKDYHSMNLHFCPHKKHQLGVIDYQDGFWGPWTYDLVSLLEDRYIPWDKTLEAQVIEKYRKRIVAELGIQCAQASFFEAYHWMGLQRNLRILGVFARLAIRDQKPAYLKLMPRFWEYCRYSLQILPELECLNHVFDKPLLLK